MNHEHQINYCEKRFKFEYFVTEQVCDSQKNYLWIIKKKKNYHQHQGKKVSRRNDDVTRNDGETRKDAPSS